MVLHFHLSLYVVTYPLNLLADFEFEKWCPSLWKHIPFAIWVLRVILSIWNWCGIVYWYHLSTTDLCTSLLRSSKPVVNSNFCPRSRTDNKACTCCVVSRFVLIVTGGACSLPAVPKRCWNQGRVKVGAIGMKLWRGLLMCILALRNLTGPANSSLWVWCLNVLCLLKKKVSG